MKRGELKGMIEDLVDSAFKDQPIEKEASFLPFTPYMGMVYPGQQIQFVARPQLPFRGERLVVWSKCALHFFINALYVGNQVLGAQAGDIPADAFATDMDMLAKLDEQLDKKGFVSVLASKKAVEAMGQKLYFPLAQVSMDIRMVVTNVGDKPWKFCSVLFGNVEHRGGFY